MSNTETLSLRLIETEYGAFFRGSRRTAEEQKKLIHTVPRLASLPLFSGVIITANHIREGKAMMMTMMMTAV